MSALDLSTLELKHGSHTSPQEGVCLMEAVALFANEPHSDHPQCACPVLTRFGMSLNDRMNDENRQKLKPFIPLLVGTRNPALEKKRAYFLVDRTVRLFAPIALRHAGDALEKAKLEEHAVKLRAHAQNLESLDEITGPAAAADAAAAAARWAAAAADAAAAAARWAAADAAAAAAAAADAARWAAAAAARWAAADAAAAAAAAAARSKVWDLAIEVFGQAIAITEKAGQ